MNLAAQTMPAISIDINMFWQIINFLVLIVIFNKYLKKPLNKVLKQRKDIISNDLEEAKKNKEDAKKEKEEANEKLKEAKKQVHDIIINAEKKADQRKEEILRGATSQRDKILKSAEIEVGKMKARAKTEIREEMQILAVKLAEKIIKEKLDSKHSNQLINNFIDELGED
ncbi:MAG: F0F1 ATP synthase subunit B [Fusobacterium sp.]